MSDKDIILVQGREYLHIRQAAKILGLSQETARAGCRGGSVVCVQIGGAWYLQKTSLKSFLRQIQDKEAAKRTEVSRVRRTERMEIAKKSKNVKRLFRVGNEIGKIKRL
jgi:hypothetical protein